jgi:hypothetical protein
MSARVGRLGKIVAVLAITSLASQTQAAEGATTRFWNLTGETITQLYLAPAGTSDWGPNQCLNDRDGSVDFDERLRVTGVSTGRYDIRFTDKTGRRCIVKNVMVAIGAVFAIDKDMSDHCGRE